MRGENSRFETMAIAWDFVITKTADQVSALFTPPITRENCFLVGARCNSYQNGLIAFASLVPIYAVAEIRSVNLDWGRFIRPFSLAGGSLYPLLYNTVSFNSNDSYVGRLQLEPGVQTILSVTLDTTSADIIVGESAYVFAELHFEVFS